MNPFDAKPTRLENLFLDWQSMRPKPYDKHTVDPYTRTRLILMNGTEFEANWFSHQFSRNCNNNDVRRELAMLRRQEQQQQKLLSLLKPADETILETTIGYEQLAVDLTSALAQREPDAHVKQALDFALLEDFDHLYRYANLLDMEYGIHAEDLVGHYTEITPARPTIAHHRYPMDSIKCPIDKNAAQESKLCVGIITAAEQQTMNFYMNVCGLYPNDLGRKLYQEIGMVEEQHVSQYGSLMDVNCTWLENLVMRQYTECFLYYSCMETETDENIRKIWEQFYAMETAHLQVAARLLQEIENKDAQSLVGTDFPKPLKLCSNIDYVRGVLTSSVQNTALRESYGSVDNLRPDCDFFRYQRHINQHTQFVTSHEVICRHIDRFGQDYRWEKSTNPIPPLRNRVVDDTAVGRVPEAVFAKA